MTPLKIVLAIFGTNNRCSKYNKGLVTLLHKLRDQFVDATVLLAYDTSSATFVDSLRDRFAQLKCFDMTGENFQGEGRACWRIHLMCTACDGPGMYVPMDVDAHDHFLCMQWAKQMIGMQHNVDTLIYRSLSFEAREYIAALPITCDLCDTCFVVQDPTCWRTFYTPFLSLYRGALHSRVALAAFVLDAADVIDCIPHKNIGYGVDEILLTYLIEIATHVAPVLVHNLPIAYKCARFANKPAFAIRSSV